MSEPVYHLPVNPAYSEAIRRLCDSDPASASGTFNPLVEAILENIHFVKLRLDALAAGSNRYVVAVRPRAPGKPDYGMGGGGEDGGSVALLTGPYTGTTEAGVVVSGVLYDAKNLGFDGEDSPDGTILIKTEENENG